jgi:hypothetical protein
MTENVPKIGVIAEDKSDIDCLKALICRICPENKPVVKGRGVGGGGNMFNPRTMHLWIQALAEDNCRYLIVVHDLDRDKNTGALNDENALRARLGQAINGCAIASRCVVVPIEEIEAWLLSDRIDKPQEVHDPKLEFTKRNRNWRSSNNAKLAQTIDIALIVQKCPSFRPLHTFVQGIYNTDEQKGKI